MFTPSFDSEKPWGDYSTIRAGLFPLHVNGRIRYTVYLPFNECQEAGIQVFLTQV